MLLVLLKITKFVMKNEVCINENRIRTRYILLYRLKYAIVYLIILTNELHDISFFSLTLNFI